MKHTDIQGIPLDIGDTVAYENVGYKGLSIGTIVRFTPKTVVVVHESDKRDKPNEIGRYCVVKLNRRTHEED